MALHRYMDNWRGAGGVIDPMRAEALSTVDDGIRCADFSRHPVTASDGFGEAPTPWGAVQRAVRAALRAATR